MKALRVRTLVLKAGLTCLVFAMLLLTWRGVGVSSDDAAAKVDDAVYRFAPAASNVRSVKAMEVPLRGKWCHLTDIGLGAAEIIRPMSFYVVFCRNLVVHNLNRKV